LAALKGNPDGLTDAELAGLIGATRQTVNQTCRQLAAEHLIRRDDHNESGEVSAHTE
jgi:DNA-binding IclR family transcriptional regulator